MSDEKENTTETKETTGTVQFSARVKAEDKTFVEEYMQPFKTRHEGFNAIVNSLKIADQVKNKTFTVETKEVEKPLNPGEYIICFNDPLNDKLKALRRYLKQKELIPADSSEKEFIQMFILSAIETKIEKSYNFLNR